MSEVPPLDAVIVQMAWCMTDAPTGRCPVSLIRGRFIATQECCVFYGGGTVSRCYKQIKFGTTETFYVQFVL